MSQDKDATEAPEGLERKKQQYLLKHALQRSFRALYGDRAAADLTRLTEEVAEKLLDNGVRIR